jgi:hypothetical protein
LKSLAKTVARAGLVSHDDLPNTAAPREPERPDVDAHHISPSFCCRWQLHWHSAGLVQAL